MAHSFSLHYIAYKFISGSQFCNPICQVQGFPLRLYFPTAFHLNRQHQVWHEGVKGWIWYLRGTVGHGSHAFYPERFPWIKAAAGPHSSSSWSCQYRLSGWWRDRLQTDYGVARWGWEPSHQTPKWLWQFAPDDRLCMIYCHLTFFVLQAKQNLLITRSIESVNTDKKQTFPTQVV